MPIPSSRRPIRASAKNIVYQTVCDWIVTGVLRPGEKIVDAELAEYFNVSRTPVREALQMLQSQKLVMVRPGKTTEVTPINFNDIEKCYRPLAEIQGLAAELACGKIAERELERLKKIHETFAQAASDRDTDAMVEQDALFHELIVDEADNEYISDFSHVLNIHIQRLKYNYFKRDIVRFSSVNQHQEILAAVNEGNAELAHMRMKNHWLFVMEEVRKEAVL